MIHLTGKPSINAAQACSILQSYTDRMGIFIDLDRVCEYRAYFKNKMRNPTREFQLMAGSSGISPNSRAEVIDVLTRRFNVPRAKLINPMSRKLALDKEVITSLLEDPTISEDTHQFLLLRKELGDYGKRISALNQFVDLPLCKVESYDNRRMVIAQPRWRVLSTGRIAAQDPGIQALYRDFGDIYTYPKGYILFFSDSGQIEPRITYSYFIKNQRIYDLIMLYNDAYYGLLHYVLYNDHEDKLEITDKLKDQRKQLKTLSLATNYGSALKSNKFDQELATQFITKVQQDPARRRWVSDIEEAVSRGADTFYTAFGTAITPDENARYRKDSPGWEGHIQRCGINNPVQGTAGDLMCQSVYEADKILRTRAKGFSAIMMYKHDEGGFYLQECDIGLKEELSECLSYQVPGWIPIYCEVEGRKKGHDTSDLMFG